MKNCALGATPRVVLGETAALLGKIAARTLELFTAADDRTIPLDSPACGHDHPRLCEPRGNDCGSFYAPETAPIFCSTLARSWVSER